jgi:hypothetical protein
MHVDRLGQGPRNCVDRGPHDSKLVEPVRFAIRSNPKRLLSARPNVRKEFVISRLVMGNEDRTIANRTV